MCRTWSGSRKGRVTCPGVRHGCDVGDGAREERVERRPQERGERRSLFSSLYFLSLLTPALFLAAVESRNQTGQHASDFFELGLEACMASIRHQLASPSKLKKGHTFLRKAPSDPEEISSVACGEAAVAFGEVSGNRQRGAIELIDREPITAREGLGKGADRFGEIDGFLVDEEFLEHEGQGQTPGNGRVTCAWGSKLQTPSAVEKRGESREETAGARREKESLLFALLSPLSSLLLYFLPLCGKKSGRPDSNWRLPAPKAGALTRLRYAPVGRKSGGGRWQVVPAAGWSSRRRPSFPC